VFENHALLRISKTAVALCRSAIHRYLPQLFTLVALAGFLSASPCAAQITNSSILGHVYDPSGQVIANAVVVVSDVNSSLIRETTTDSVGSFTVLGLNPETYSISASAPNFAQATESNVYLAVNTQLRVDFHLTIAGVQKTIAVSSSANPLQTESAEMSTVVTQQQIQNLPLDPRNFLELALLSPGVLPPSENSELSTRGAFSMDSAGAREEYNNFLIDGVDNNDPYVDRYGVEPPVDSIQEFKVATSNSDAEYGRSAGGQVNVITRSGTNDLHGSIYEYLRNQALDARNFFDGPIEPQLTQDQFGFSVGGPIVKRKTFFFAATDFYRNKEGISALSAVPTTAERQGNLSALCQTGFTNGLCNPAPANSTLSAVQVVNPLTGSPFLNDMIPSGVISPIATDILNLYPAAPAGSTGTVAYATSSPVQTENDYQGTYRVDHHFSESKLLTFRYSFGAVNLFEPFAGTGITVPGFGDDVTDRIQNAMILFQQAIGTRGTNSIRIGYNRFRRTILTQNSNVNVGSLWGVNWLNVPPIAYGYPELTIQGFSELGDNYSLPISRVTNTFQLGDDLSLDRGPHLFKIGGEFRDLQLNGILDLLNRGSLSFLGGLSGSGISDLLLGYPSLAIQVQSDNPLAMRTKALNFYFEDDWHILRKLTLNLGIRYEYNTPMTDPRNQMYTLNLHTGEIVQVGTDGVSPSGINPDYHNIAPRVGVSWNFSPNWVARSGYGIYYDSGMFTVNSAQYFNPPIFNLSVYFPSAAGLLTLQNPFPSTAGYTPPPGLNVLNPNLPTPYIQQWNLSLQRSLGPWGNFTASYAGSKGTKLVRPYDLNQPPPSPTDLQTARAEQNPLYGDYGNIFFIDDGGNSTFNSLQLNYNRTLGTRVSVSAAYTYSHSIDDASAFLGLQQDPNFPQDSHDLESDRGNSGFDMRHRVVAAFVVHLPKGNIWTRNTQFRGIVSAGTGQPFTPIISSDNGNTGNTGGTSAGTDRPNIIGNPNAGACPNPNGGAPIPVGTVNCWFNTSAFAVAPEYTFGDAGRNILFGPGFSSVDVSLYRLFNLSERFKLSAEVQAFNLFNHTNFDLPQNYADNPSTFGRIFSANAPRQLQLAARFAF
jgi:hypothetical protein